LFDANEDHFLRSDVDKSKIAFDVLNPVKKMNRSIKAKSLVIFVLKITFINFITLLFGIVLLELIFGNWFGPQDPMSRLSLFKDDTIKYDTSHLYKSEQGYSIYTRDRFALRGVYEGLDQIDILTIGGSTTDQRMVSEGKTWQDVLRDSFSRDNKKVTVVNAGLDGQSTFGHINNFEWWFPNLPNFKVKYFMFYIGINDQFVTENPREFDTRLTDRSAIKSTIVARSAVFRLLRIVRGIYLSNFVHKVSHRRIDLEEQEWESEGLIEDYEQFMEKRLEGYEKRLEVLLKHVRALNSKTIFVTQPSRIYKRVGSEIVGVTDISSYDGRNINGVDRYHILASYNAETMRVCEEAGETCVNLEQELDFTDEDFYDFYHMTPQGAEKIGKYLHSKLKHLF